MEIKRVFEVKQNGKWVEGYSNTDPVEVYKWLSDSLIAKKINACQYIRAIKRENLYNGFQRITVTYSNDYGGRSVFYVPN